MAAPRGQSSGDSNGAPTRGDIVARALRPYGARLTTKERAARSGHSVWRMEQLEAAEVEQPEARLPAVAGASATAMKLRPAVIEEPPPVETDPELEPTPGIGPGTLLVLGSLVLLVVIRFFSEVVEVLPGFTNFVDIPIFAMILFAAALSPPMAREIRRLPTMLGLAGFLFVVVCAISTLVNLSRIDVAPALVFVYGNIAPVALFFAIYKLWPPGSSLRLSRVLVALGLLQLAVAFLIDLPLWFADPGRNPDLFSGTFGENPYQLVFFLLLIVGLLAGIFTFEKRRFVAPLTPFLLIAIFVVTFLAQYRALLLTMALTIVLLGVLLAPLSARGVVGAAFVMLALAGTLVYAAQNIPEFKFQATIEDSGGDPTFYLKQRLKTIDPVERMFADTPRFALTGSGPGTYSSRAWRTFAVTADSETEVTSGYAQKLIGGRPYRTDVSDKYLRPELRKATVISGSYALSSPYSSYTSVAAEVGAPGLFLIVGIYLWGLLSSLRMARISFRMAKPGDPLPGLLCASLIAFFALLQMGILGNWLEVTRISFISWIIFAVATKEFNARRRSDEAPAGTAIVRA